MHHSKYDKLRHNTVNSQCILNEGYEKCWGGRPPSGSKKAFFTVEFSVLELIFNLMAGTLKTDVFYKKEKPLTANYI